MLNLNFIGVQCICISHLHTEFGSTISEIVDSLCIYHSGTSDLCTNDNSGPPTKNVWSLYSVSEFRGYPIYCFVFYWLIILSRASKSLTVNVSLTGSIARSAKCRLFNLLRGRFWGFSPRRGHRLHRWGWKLARRREPKVPSSVPNFTPIGATIRV